MIKGAEIREIRQRLGLTQKQFSERVGVVENTIARYERDERSPSQAVENMIRMLGQNGVPL